MNKPTYTPLTYSAAETFTRVPKEGWRVRPSGLNFADPMLLDDTARSGYFYLYGTGMICARSKDLNSWEKLGNFITLEGEAAGLDWRWAPEVIYDVDTHRYYCFFSSHPNPDATVGETSAVPGFVTLVAVAENAAGPFRLVDLTDPASCGEENVRKLDTRRYPQYYNKYALLDGEEYWKALTKTGLRITEGNEIYQSSRGPQGGVYVNAIDLSPFRDPVTGKKYLFWSQTPGSIAGVEMINWFTPDWSTFRVLTCDHFYTVEDYAAYMKDPASVSGFSYERKAPYCNEGPFMLYHNGKYYLTFSIGHYLEASYSVLQAVGDSPLGPFRKLTEEENGVLLCCDLGRNGFTSGTGHHSFATIRTNDGDKLIMAYHAYDSAVAGKSDRMTRFDEVKWITVTDKYGQPLDVMYLDGPSVTPQPDFGIKGDRGDLTDRISSITLLRGTFASDSTAEALTDGLITYRHRVCETFEEEYVPETEVRETSTFEITLTTPQDLTGILFYPSKHADKRPSAIRDIVFTCEVDGLIRRVGIEELTAATTWAPGSGMGAAFESIRVLNIRFTLCVPEGQASAALSEVTLIGIRR